jgi:hypothetical protein
VITPQTRIPEVYFLISWVGWNCVQLARRPLFGLSYQTRIIDHDECGTVCGMRTVMGNRSTPRIPAPVHFIHHKSYMT